MSVISDQVSGWLKGAMNTDVVAIRLARHAKLDHFDLNANQADVLAAIHGEFSELNPDELLAVFQLALKYSK